MNTSVLQKIKAIKEKYQVIRRELISSYQQGYLGKKTYQYYLNDGTVKTCEQITKHHSNGDAVVIIPMLDNDNFLMILESRPNTQEQVVLEFPAGMIDEGESPSSSATRELLEETGYTPTSLELLESHYQDQGCSQAIIYTFLATGCQKIQEQQLDESEKIEPLVLTEEDIISGLLDNNSIIRDANTKLAYHEYALRKKRKENEI